MSKYCNEKCHFGNVFTVQHRHVICYHNQNLDLDMLCLSHSQERIVHVIKRILISANVFIHIHQFSIFSQSLIFVIWVIELFCKIHLLLISDHTDCWTELDNK